MENLLAKVIVTLNDKRYEYTYSYLNGTMDDDWMMWLYDFLQVETVEELENYAFEYGLLPLSTEEHFRWYHVDADGNKVFVSENGTEWKELIPSYEF